jgi:nucleoside-diphosphate-sugar epimerase
MNGGINGILVTGANGQIGTELVTALVRVHGGERILASDLHDEPSLGENGAVRYERLDVTNAEELRAIIAGNNVGTIYHLASLLSASGEDHPDRSWDVNVNGLKHVLDAARDVGCQVFWPSSIAVFGPETPKVRTPQRTVLDPSTMYGVTKVSGELLCRYYCRKFGVDVRSLRYPGLISYTTPPGGGTTDYAVEMFYSAVSGSEYVCFVRPETQLPMMYMPDAVRAALELMDVDGARISVRTSYNIGAASFTAGELAEAIARRVPDFTVRFEPDHRQEIADSWPSTVDDTKAREDWGWKPAFDATAIVDDMLENLFASKSDPAPWIVR